MPLPGFVITTVIHHSIQFKALDLKNLKKNLH